MLNIPLLMKGLPTFTGNEIVQKICKSTLSNIILYSKTLVSIKKSYSL
jgi:hypothetical protein